MEDVTARDLMSREYVGVSEGDDLSEVLELMVDERADDVLVLRGSDPVGVVSSHDALRTVVDDEPEGEPVESVMRPPPESVTVDSDIGSVLSRLAGTDGGQLPVTNGDRELVGVVTEADVIAAATSMVTEPRAVEPATEPGSAPERVGSPSTGTFAEGQTSATREGTEAYSNQGVCESCGALSGDLQVQNGQSVCPDCRDV